MVASEGGGGDGDCSGAWSGSVFGVGAGEYRTEVAGVYADDEVVLADGSGL